MSDDGRISRPELFTVEAAGLMQQVGFTENDRNFQYVLYLTRELLAAKREQLSAMYGLDKTLLTAWDRYKHSLLPELIIMKARFNSKDL